MSHPYPSPQWVPPGYYLPYSQPLPPQNAPYPTSPLPQYPPNTQLPQQPPPPDPTLNVSAPPTPGPPLYVSRLPVHQPHSSQACTLHVQNSGIPTPQLLITDALTSTLLYTITSPPRSSLSSTQHLSIESSLVNNSSIATVRFHRIMSEDIDLVIHKQPVPFKDSSFSLTHSHELKSKVSGVRKLKWKNHNALKGGDIRGTDSHGNVVARFEAKAWTEVQKEGEFELSPTVATHGAVMDEVVVRGIAMEFVRRKGGILGWGLWLM